MNKSSQWLGVLEINITISKNPLSLKKIIRIRHMHIFTKLQMANIKTQWWSWRLVMMLSKEQPCTQIHIQANCADKKGSSHDRFPGDCTCRDLRSSVPFDLKCIQKEFKHSWNHASPSQSGLIMTSHSHSTLVWGYRSEPKNPLRTLSNRDSKWFLSWNSHDQILFKVIVSLILAACEGREDAWARKVGTCRCSAVGRLSTARPVWLHPPQLGLLHPLLQGCL